MDCLEGDGAITTVEPEIEISLFHHFLPSVNLCQKCHLDYLLDLIGTFDR